MAVDWKSYLKGLMKIYDEKIDFLDYWKEIHPNDDLKFPKPCELHDETSGHSLAYSPSKKIWSCFGACKVMGQKVVEYHYRYLKKKNRGITYVKVLRDLRAMFPQLQLPKVMSSTDFITPEVSKQLDKNYMKNIEKSLDRTRINKTEIEAILNQDHIDYKNRVNNCEVTEELSKSKIEDLEFFKLFTNEYIRRSEQLKDEQKKGE